LICKDTFPRIKRFIARPVVNVQFYTFLITLKIY